MKVAIINGSPRSNGNSGFIAKKAVDFLMEEKVKATIINVNDILKTLKFF